MPSSIKRSIAASSRSVSSRSTSRLCSPNAGAACSARSGVSESRTACPNTRSRANRACGSAWKKSRAASCGSAIDIPRVEHRRRRDADRLELGRGLPIGARRPSTRRRTSSSASSCSSRELQTSRIARPCRATRGPARRTARPTSRRSRPTPPPTDRPRARDRARAVRGLRPDCRAPRAPRRRAARRRPSGRGTRASSRTATPRGGRPHRSRPRRMSAASTATVAACADTKSGYAKPICTGSRSGQPMRWSMPAAAERL